MGKYQDYTPDTSKDKAVGFTLYGIDFDCHPALPFGVITDFADKFTAFTESGPADGADEDATVGATMLRDILGAVDDLFRTAIVDPVKYQEWVVLQRDPQRVVKMSTLMDISQDLLDQYMTDEAGNDRPTGHQSSKRSGKKSRGDASRAGAPREVSTYTRSEQIAG